MKKKLLVIVTCLIVFSAGVKAQFWEQLSFQALAGYTNAQGSKFKTESGQKLSSFGLNFDIDVLYHFNALDNKLGVGLTWDGSVLFAADLDGFSKGGVYGLQLVGPKAQYRFLSRNISPYVALSFGGARLSTPNVTISDGSGNSVEVLANKAWNFGVRPEVGVDLNGFIISVAYIVPMQYDLGSIKETAGGLEFSIGYRKTIFYW